MLLYIHKGKIQQITKAKCKLNNIDCSAQIHWKVVPTYLGRCLELRPHEVTDGNESLVNALCKLDEINDQIDVNEVSVSDIAATIEAIIEDQVYAVDAIKLEFLFDNQFKSKVSFMYSYKIF